MSLPVLVAPQPSNSAWSGVGQYAKGIIAVASAVIASLQPFYGSQHWFVALVAGIGALAVILIPNQSK